MSALSAYRPNTVGETSIPNVTKADSNIYAEISNYKIGAKNPQQFQHPTSLPNPPRGDILPHSTPSQPPIFTSTDANGTKNESDGEAFEERGRVMGREGERVVRNWPHHYMCIMSKARLLHIA